jgi:hypothetical protein
VTTLRFVAGLDLGQAQDYSALAIVERVRRQGDRLPSYDVRHLERWPLGTAYPDVVAGAGERVRAVRALEAECPLVVDKTGVGAVVVDLFVRAKLRPLVAVTITGGDRMTEDANGAIPAFRTPKRDLVATVQVLLGEDRLRIAADLPESAVLAAELTNFRVKIGAGGHDAYGAGTDLDDWRTGANDDLVLALALALWHAEHAPTPTPFIDWPGTGVSSAWGTGVRRDAHDGTMRRRIHGTDIGAAARLLKDGW